MEDMVVRLSGLISTARDGAVPVVFVRTEHDRSSDSATWRARLGSVRDYDQERCQPGTSGSEFYGIAPINGEPIVTKHRYDGFVGTDLDQRLRAMRRESIVVAGVMTDVCVETTVRHAVCLDYLVTVVTDCCEATSSERHESAVARISQGFGLAATANGVKALWNGASSRESERTLSAPSR